MIFSLNLTWSLDTAPYYTTICENPSPGYLFMTPYQPGHFFMTDNSGEPIYIKNFNNNIVLLNLKLQENGLLSYFYNMKFYLMDKNFSLVDSFACVGDYLIDFHDFLILPNNHALLIGNDKRIVDMSVLVPGGQKEALVIGSVIQELDENKGVVFQWNSFDHFKITDIVSEENLIQSTINVCHMNSICQDNDGNYITSNRDLDELTKIDRKTGNIIWRMGGSFCKNNQFTFINDTVDGVYGFSHQHSVSVLSNGNILLFDNGNKKPKQYSRALELKIDENNKTAEKVWEFLDFPIIFSNTMGNVQRLPNGNTLIGWGTNNRNITAIEVRPDGTKAFELVNYQNYAVYKYIFNSDAVIKFINNTGSYTFSDEKYYTDVSFEINSLANDGNISVEKHYYKPVNLEFYGQTPLEVFSNRWTIYSDSIKDISAIIKFKINDTLIDPADARIFYRSKEGNGSFYMLETSYIQNEKCLKAEINGFGEFIICSNPSILPPVTIYPRDSSDNIEITPTISWQAMSMASSYRFQLSKFSDMSNLITDTSGFIDPWIQPALENNTRYYWRVRAFYGNEKSPWSKVYLFITVPKDILLPPFLKFPIDRDTLVATTGTLKWDDIEGVLYYNVELALDPGFMTTVLKRNYIASNYINYNNLFPLTQHYWHVASSNGYYNSPWSQSWMFMTDQASNIINPLDIDKIEINQSNNKLILNFDDIFHGQFIMGIYDIRGYIIKDANGYVNDLNNNTIELDISSLNSGYYLYRIIIEDKIYSGKILIN